MIDKKEIAATYQQIQDEICSGLEKADGAEHFEEELWSREGGGGGRTRILQEGNVIERGGVNFSAVYGKLPENIKKAFKVDENDFFATGVSIVIHPGNPWVPIIHMNIRYFELNEETRWFGGGIDLTPHYVVPEDAVFFHQYLKKICDEFSPAFYQRFKDWADDYFFIKHRNETRGIGGIFYDRLQPEGTGLDYEHIFDFSKALGRSFLPIYTELIAKSKDKVFTAQHKEWQYLRRSRYVEFNLVYDSGTKFGLETNGRIESILMSLPPQARWKYNYQTPRDSEEERTLSWLKKGVDWVGIS
ncbi:oxygen-dependent coproporphyrinogen oxidase [Olivibacter sp. SDN3]|uniref:oxygen-dependent coproporphyrinogen oxidase n=1 Tax=Olivibacter sp. SDN3 TaxID=2764720 RepID=UPI001650FC61|nr:oxygen-dependent coproporphyrinogen oxidase [Olivibacter sp. SDN3]QNL48577.1 oxygen-dependent coproporphyrinogen oxidase [Olivibacter sp. SDN3]